MLLAIKPLIGNNINVAATCDTKTMNDNNAVPLTVNGIKHSNNNEAVHENRPIQNHLRKLSDISIIGPHRKRQRFAETPHATTLAVAATGNPFFVSRNGNATVTKPLLMPVGSTRKNI